MITACVLGDVVASISVAQRLVMDKWCSNELKLNFPSPPSQIDAMGGGEWQTLQSSSLLHLNYKGDAWEKYKGESKAIVRSMYVRE